jgi:hypothetical protein
LLRVPVAVGVTTIVTVSSAPLASVPSKQLIVLVPVQGPAVELAETFVTPAGSVTA